MIVPPLAITGEELSLLMQNAVKMIESVGRKVKRSGQVT